MVKSKDCGYHPENELCWRCWTAQWFSDELDFIDEDRTRVPYDERPDYLLFRFVFKDKAAANLFNHTFDRMSIAGFEAQHNNCVIFMRMPLGVVESLVFPGLVSSALVELAQPNQ